MRNVTPLLGYVYISKACKATAVGLWRKTVGAEDPASSVHTFLGFRIMLAALLVHTFQREAWSCSLRPHVSTVGTKAQQEGLIRRLMSKFINDLQHHVDIVLSCLHTVLGFLVVL